MTVDLGGDVQRGKLDGHAVSLSLVEYEAEDEELPRNGRLFLLDLNDV